MSCNCNESGFKEHKTTSSYNRNCSYGTILVLLIVVTIVLFILSIRRPKLRLIAFLLLAKIIIVIILYPILLLYIPSAYLSSIVDTPEFLEKSTYFPNHLHFEDPSIFPFLKAEVDSMLQRTNNGNDLILTKETFSGNNAKIGKDIRTEGKVTRGWRVMNVMTAYQYTPYAKHFPYLTSLLANHPEIVACVISVLEPGITIPIHVGYYKGLMRYMLATHVPQDRENVFLCVNGKKYHWAEGEGVLWDDNFPHKVYNHTQETRVVIYMDVERPLTGFAKHLNRFIINAAAGSKIVKDEVSRTEKQVKL